MCKPYNRNRNMATIDRLRGMSNIPLDSTGEAEAVKVAKRLAQRGGVLGVSSSPLTRAVQTAAEILKRIPAAKMHEVTAQLEPWHLGMFEGEPSAEVHNYMVPYVQDPTKIVPGVGANSKIPGESLQDYLDRFLPYLKKQLDLNPKGYGMILVCHYRNIKAADAWAKAGAKDDWKVDPKEFLAYEEADPASLWCVEYENGKLVVKPEDLFEEDEPLDDLYLLRHGKTALNGSGGSEGGSSRAKSILSTGS